MLLNAQPEAMRFVLPDAHPGSCWEPLIDTASPGSSGSPMRLAVGAELSLDARSLVLLRACDR